MSAKKPNSQYQQWLTDLANKKPGPAKADAFKLTEQKIEKNGIVMLDVMANDTGGRKADLFAVSSSAAPDTDLLQRDAAYTSVAEVTAWEYSSNGARFAIVNGKIAYDGTFLAFTLGQGERVVDHISYAIKLPNGHLSFTTVAIAITGTNDAPTLQASYSGSTVLSEDADPWNGTTVSTYGAFNATDLDLTDTLTANVKAVHLSGAVGSLTEAQVASLFSLQQSSLTADYYEGNNLGWNFNADETTFDFLKDGEQLVLAYDVQVTDNHGATAQDTVTITINGITDLPYNVAPVVAIKDGDSAGESLSEGTGQNLPLYASGTLSISDENRKDALTAAIKSVTVEDATQSITAEQVAGLLQLGSIYQPQADHNLQWTFSGNSALFDNLTEGQNVTLSYSVEISDSKGGTVVTPITIVITGSNEAPVVSVAPGDVRSTVMFEDGSPLDGAVPVVTPQSISAHGTLTVADPDGSGPVSATIKYCTSVGAETYDEGWTPAVNWLSLSVDPNATTNNLSWTFNVDPKFLNHIPQNTNLPLTYVVEVTDSAGATTMTNIDIIIVGQNDAPVRVVAAGDSVAETVSSDAPQAQGHFTFYDADQGDTFYVSPRPAGISVTGNLGTHTADELLNYATSIRAQATDVIYTGVVDWAYSAPTGTFDYLAPSESVTMNYAFEVWDGHLGGFFTQSFSVTVVGAPDLLV